jgi:hypothetical protein
VALHSDKTKSNDVEEARNRARADLALAQQYFSRLKVAGEDTVEEILEEHRTEAKRE